MNQKLSRADRELIILLVREREEARLTARRLIRELSNKEIAKKFDVSPNTVCKIHRLWGEA